MGHDSSSCLFSHLTTSFLTLIHCTRIDMSTWSVGREPVIANPFKKQKGQGACHCRSFLKVHVDGIENASSKNGQGEQIRMQKVAEWNPWKHRSLSRNLRPTPLYNDICPQTHQLDYWCSLRKKAIDRRRARGIARSRIGCPTCLMDTSSLWNNQFMESGQNDPPNKLPWWKKKKVFDPLPLHYPEYSRVSSMRF